MTSPSTPLSPVSVVVDTNVISNGTGLLERPLSTLSRLASSRTITLFIPTPVLLEIERHLTIGSDKAKNALGTYLATRRALGLEVSDALVLLAKESVRWEEPLRSTLSSVGTIAEMPTTPHLDLVRRDIERRRPFKENGVGYRDALIWETVRDIAAPGTTTVLLTANHRDFGGEEVDVLQLAPLPPEASVVILKSVGDLEAWLAKPGTRMGDTNFSTHPPLPMTESSVRAALDGHVYGTVRGVRFGRRLYLDADLQAADLEMVRSATEYDPVDENVGLINVDVAGAAYVDAWISRDMIVGLDPDVRIEFEAGSDEGDVSCARPIIVRAQIQYRLDTTEIVDTYVESIEYDTRRR